MNHQPLIDLFIAHAIPHTVHQHTAVFTTEEETGIDIAGAHSKNLFLRDKKKRQYFLVSVLQEKRVNLKVLSKYLGQGGLSFGSAEKMTELLGVIPGAVTPYGLLHDTNDKVTFVLDNDFLQHEVLNFHPLRNDMTVSVARDDFLRYCEVVGHAPDCIEIPEL